MTSITQREYLCPMVDLGALKDALHSIALERSLFEIFGSLSSYIGEEGAQLWLQIDGEASIRNARGYRSSDGAPTTEWVLNEGVDSSPRVDTSGIDIHARLKSLRSIHCRSEPRSRLCFQDAILVLSRSGSPISGDRFFCTPLSHVSSLMEGRSIKVNGRPVGTVVRNSGGLLKIAFSSDCTIDQIDELITNIILFNPITNLIPRAVLDWSFSCYYLGRPGQKDVSNMTGHVTSGQPLPTLHAC